MPDIIYNLHAVAGRSGHIIKDLFTTIILEEFTNYTACYTKGWERQNILPIAHIKKHLKPIECSSVIPVQTEKRYVDGVNFRHFKTVVNYFEFIEDPKNLIILGRVFRVHLAQIKNWETLGKVPEGSFDRIRNRLRLLYWDKVITPIPVKRDKIKNIVIHIRRGDIAHPTHKLFYTRGAGKWTSEYYKGKIQELLQKFPKASITIFTEELNSEDLNVLESTKVKIERGGVEEIDDHIRRMITADLFVPSNSGFSLWASLITCNYVYLLDGAKTIDHLSMNESPDNFIEVL